MTSQPEARVAWRPVATEAGDLRLYRVDAARGGGAGLGLSIVRGIAALHGGSVSLESEIGVGTRVGVWFPAATPS